MTKPLTREELDILRTLVEFRMPINPNYILPRLIATIDELEAMRSDS